MKLKPITEDMAHCNRECLELLKGTHVLIAGTTGSGKSVMLNSMIYNILRADKGQLFLIDLKRVELSIYKHVAVKTCTEPYRVVPMLEGVVDIMEERYKKMKRRGERLTSEVPIYVIIDELADLVTIKGVLPLLVKIGRLGRAAKIHTICATQDPSRRTLPAAYMQNVTCALALRCRSDIESRQIIGVSGAERLPKYGKGILWDAEGIRTIDIPLMMSLRMLGSRIRLSAGPLFTVKCDTEYPEGDKTAFFGPIYPTCNLAAGVGVGLSRHFIIEARYIYGLGECINQYRGVEFTTQTSRLSVGMTLFF